MNQSKRKYFFIPLGMIAFIIMCIFLTIFLLTSIYGKPSKKSLIKKYKNNEEMFEKVKEELYALEGNDIYVFKEGTNVYVSVYTEDGSAITQDIEECHSQYENTIRIIKHLNLKEVNKEGQNIIFSMSGFGQDIVMMKNEKEYNWKHHIIEKEHLKNNWYYIEIKI